MDAITCLKSRRSIRTYTGAPVADETVADIVDCARLAPTAMNRQPWTFVVIRDARTREQIAELTGHAVFIAQAPVCVAVLCQEGEYWVEDGSAATLNLLNGARAHGLGSCWVAGHPLDYAPAIATLLGAPSDHRLLSLVSIGWPGEEPAPEKRRLEDVLRWERF
jgi:nitroreductase